jgi:lipopolysaccharide biosynthesis regulator YciM
VSAAAVAAIALVVVLAAAVGWSVSRSRTRRPRGQPPYIVALNALVDGDEETAVREFKSAVRVDSTNVDAYLRLGDLFRARGEAERALHLHRELAFRERIAKSDRARVQEALCRDYIALGRFDKASEAAREAVKLNDDPGAGMALLLDVSERLGDIEGAFKVKKDILKREGRAKSGAADLADFRAGQGAGLLEKGELKEAERVLRDARRLDGENRRARRLWGLLRERTGDYAEAIEAWEGLLADGPEEGEDLFHDLERVRFLHGSFSDMQSTYHRFLDGNPGHEVATFGLARFLRRKGQLDDALDVCRRGLGANEGSLHLRVLHLALLLQSGRSAEAEAALNEWLTGLGDESPAGESPAGEAPLVEAPS